MAIRIDDSGFISVLDAARMLGVSRSKVYALMSQRRLTYIDLGGLRRIRRSDLDTLVALSTVIAKTDKVPAEVANP